MKKFDTKVQELKYQVLREVARHAWQGDSYVSLIDIPKRIVSGKAPTMRCCVYKERAILAERVKLAVGGNRDDPNVIEVIDIACDGCPAGGCEVTNACRGCLAHRCGDVCPKGAITFDLNQKAVIDKNKCVECGLCAKACPYSAIVSLKRPCVNSCKVNAVLMDADRNARIDGAKCIACGACVYQCPFGAMQDKSFVLDLINLIRQSGGNTAYKLYAVVAPSVAGQFMDARLGQVVSGLKKLGFFEVVEAALGADIAAYAEAEEWARKGFLTTSCCPAFVTYVETQFPSLKGWISQTLSPMAAIAKYIKSVDKTAKVAFIGPCTAKKAEFRKPSVKGFIDVVITFEELQALFDSRDIDLAALGDGALDNASYFGRIFARSGGVTDAVRQAVKEKGITPFAAFAPLVCDGVEQCRAALLRAQRAVSQGNVPGCAAALKAQGVVLPENFIEGMACVSGCIGGAGCLTHGEKNRRSVDEYGRQALEKTIRDALGQLAGGDAGVSAK
ncbi:MAG: monomeric [FeFe] hydrogenase [Clostridiales bacterium]|jgi:[FeFe] hydrogenase (group B1/B3)|nr:monomeric [FeFe] hydrogenase [Clostridiales bacterium]